jgi:hypothetical protein
MDPNSEVGFGHHSSGDLERTTGTGWDESDGVRRGKNKGNASYAERGIVLKCTY